MLSPELESILASSEFTAEQTQQVRDFLSTVDSALIPKSLSELLGGDIDTNLSFANLLEDPHFINGNFIGPASVPEPTTGLLFVSGLIALLIWRLRIRVIEW